MYLNLAKIFLLRLFKMVANQTEWFRLDVGSVIKFSVAEKWNLQKNVWYIYMGKHVLVQNVYKWAIHKSMEWKYNDSLAKRMFWAQWSVKKVLLTVYLDMKGSMTIDFLKKGSTVNSAFSRQLLKQNYSYSLTDTCVGGYLSIYLSIHTLNVPYR